MMEPNPCGIEKWDVVEKIMLKAVPKDKLEVIVYNEAKP